MRYARPVVAAALAMLAVATTGVAEQPFRSLRFGVVNFYNPRLMYIKYQPLIDYLTEKTGRPWKLELSASYEKTVEALCDGGLDVAYLGPLTYVRAHERCGALPIVQLQTNGQADYKGLIMVRTDSPVRSVAELRGKRIGFGAPLSTSSHLVALEMLEDAGLRPGRDVGCRYFYHHERAARAVLLGEVEACALRDIVGERFTQRGLRVLAASSRLPNFPFVVTPHAEAGLRQQLVKALVDLPAHDANARAVIAGWDEELAGGFALSSDSEFEPVRQLARRIFGPRALTLPEEALMCGTGKP